MAQRELDNMLGTTCWHVSAGGSTAPSFVLVLGEKVPRSTPLRNMAQPQQYREYRGSVELLIWSSWRLQNSTTVLATSDQGERGLSQLASLNGQKVIGIKCLPPAWDLIIDFSDGQRLLTFSDHLEPDASISENWELWVDGRHLVAGPGNRLAQERK